MEDKRARFEGLLRIMMSTILSVILCETRLTSWCTPRAGHHPTLTINSCVGSEQIRIQRYSEIKNLEYDILSFLSHFYVFYILLFSAVSCLLYVINVYTSICQKKIIFHKKATIEIFPDQNLLYTTDKICIPN